MQAQKGKFIATNAQSYLMRQNLNAVLQKKGHFFTSTVVHLVSQSILTLIMGLFGMEDQYMTEEVFMLKDQCQVISSSEIVE